MKTRITDIMPDAVLTPNEEGASALLYDLLCNHHDDYCIPDYELEMLASSSLFMSVAKHAAVLPVDERTCLQQFLVFIYLSVAHMDNEDYDHGVAV